MSKPHEAIFLSLSNGKPNGNCPRREKVRKNLWEARRFFHCSGGLLGARGEGAAAMEKEKGEAVSNKQRHKRCEDAAAMSGRFPFHLIGARR